MLLAGKKIILAVTGSIAAYKTPHLVRLLVKAGATVKVITTPAATDFVSPLALATVSKNPVLSHVSDGSAWNNHVEMGLWADVLLVAPCSANTLAKMAHGLCDNLVGAVYLSAKCPVLIAPAMDEDMWHHPSTKRNIEVLQSYGNIIIPVAHGELASGLIGEGRMAEPEALVTFITTFLQKKNDQPLQGVKALVTAGPTYERLDPVRFIGNFSTGKMGIALAESLADKGAEVTLVIGPSKFQIPNSKFCFAREKFQIVTVESAEEMYEACVQVFPTCSISILAAAVADYKPENISPEKIKKQGETISLTLTKTKDILASLGKKKKKNQLLVGFALETNNEKANALKKLKEKNADLIVLNSLKDEGAGFGHDTNKVTLIKASSKNVSLPLMSKEETANEIVNHIIQLRNAR